MPLSPYVDRALVGRSPTNGKLGEFKRAEHCPHCGQHMPSNIRYGVRLSPMKLRMFDAIKRNPGITQRQINDICYPGKKITKNTISAHVGQINDLYAHTNIKIVGYQYSGYRIEGLPRG